jgi:hypothetical protein
VRTPVFIGIFFEPISQRRVLDAGGLAEGEELGSNILHVDERNTAHLDGGDCLRERLARGLVQCRRWAKADIRKTTNRRLRSFTAAGMTTF